MRVEERTAVRGKWADYYDTSPYSEQVAVADEIDRLFDFDCDGASEGEVGEAGWGLRRATVRGFWMVDLPDDDARDKELMVRLDFGDEVQVVGFRFHEDSYDNGRAAIQQFFKVFGVGSSNAEEIVGRSCFCFESDSDSEFDTKYTLTDSKNHNVAGLIWVASVALFVVSFVGFLVLPKVVFAPLIASLVGLFVGSFWNSAITALSVPAYRVK